MASVGCWDGQRAARGACLQATGHAARLSSSTSPLLAPCRAWASSCHTFSKPSSMGGGHSPSQLSNLGIRVSVSFCTPSPCLGSLPATAQPPDYRTPGPPHCCSRAELPSHPVPQTCSILKIWKQRHCCRGLGNVI